jgi:hypothetical protein
MIKFRGLGYNTKKIHSTNIRGKYLRKTLLATLSDLLTPSIIAVVSVELLVISFFTGVAPRTLLRVRENKSKYDTDLP